MSFKLQVTWYRTFIYLPNILPSARHWKSTAVTDTQMSTIPKQHTSHVSLSGMRLNCSIVGGIVMSTISANGDTMRCKSLLGSDEGGLVTCPYQCKCPDFCSNVVAYINNKVGTSLCKICEWNISTVALFVCLCPVYNWEPIELHSPFHNNAIVIKKVLSICYRHHMASHLVSIEVVTWSQIIQGHRINAIVQRGGCEWLHTFNEMRNAYVWHTCQLLFVGVIWFYGSTMIPTSNFQQ